MVRKRIDSDVICVLENNTNGIVVHIDDRTGVYVDLAQKGEQVELTYKELKSLNAKNRTLLENMSLVIVDVEDDELDVMKVAESINLSKQYSMFNDNESEQDIISNLEQFIEETDAKGLEFKLKNSTKSVQKAICSKCVDMFNEDSFNDFSKMKVIENFLGVEDLFNDLEFSKDVI